VPFTTHYNENHVVGFDKGYELREAAPVREFVKCCFYWMFGMYSLNGIKGILGTKEGQLGTQIPAKVPNANEPKRKPYFKFGFIGNNYYGPFYGLYGLRLLINYNVGIATR
jgi:hypothetical protein